jgi:transposase
MVGWALRAGLGFLACALLLGGLAPAGEGAVVSALPRPASPLEPPLPFEAWRFDDEAGWSRSLGYPASRTAWGLAEFAPDADIDVTRVEFWTLDATTGVDVYLYDSFDGTTLGNRLAAKLNSSFDKAGKHSVTLDAPVAVTSGDHIVAVVKITNASRGHPLLLDRQGHGVALRTFASPNGRGGTWYDVEANGHGALAILLGSEPAGSTVAASGEHRVFLPLVASHYAPSTTGWAVIKAEDFEGAFPGEWQLSDQDPGEGLYYQGQRTCRAYSGDYGGWVVGGGAGAGLGCKSAYPRHVESWMVYGPFSLAGASDAELVFQMWLNSEPEYDGVFSGASIDGVDFHGYSVTGNSAGWMQYELDLTDLPVLGDITGRKEVWIALLFVSDGVVRMQEGAYIDDIVLRRYVGTPADDQEEVAPVLGGTARRKEATFSLRR